MVTDLKKIAPDLEKREKGVWYAKTQSSFSYPDEGNSLAFQAEDSLFWFKHRNKCITDLVRANPPNGALFDVGGGNGVVSLALNQAGIESILVEPGQQGIDNALSRGLTQLICATLQDAGFKDNTLPAVGMFDVLEHIEDNVNFLRDVHMALAPNGKLYLSVPAYRSLWSHEDDFAGHYRRYTLNKLRRTLRNVGFRVDYATYIFFFLPFPILLMRTIPYRLKMEKWLSPDRNKAAKSDLGWAGKTIEKILELELVSIRNEIPIPIGGSCLVAASKI